MKTISILYIDDGPEPALARYLDKEYTNDNYKIEYGDIVFDPAKEGYDGLLQNPKVKSANIVLVDSRLFENQTATKGKFTGEEFKLVLKKFYPYIEVLVITQNVIDGNIEMIPKYSFSCGKTARDYYNDILPKYIEQSIANIEQYWLLSEKMNQNDSWDEMLKSKVLATLNGSDQYDELSKNDIDNLIQAFKDIQGVLDGN